MSGEPSMSPCPPSLSATSMIVEYLMPTRSTGMLATIPASGPAMPMSKRAFLVDMGDFILMNAPNVPIGEMKGGAGMK